MNSKTPFTILAVDDHPDVLLLIKAALPEYHVITANSGEEALSMLLSHDADLILLDIRMAGKDGIETAVLLKDQKQTTDIPIIFMSAIDRTDRYVFKGFQSGAIDFIFKPFEPEILRAKVSVFAELFKKTKELQRSERELLSMNQQLQEAANRLRLLSSQLLDVQEKERKRIAGELHDGLLGSLNTIKFSLEGLVKQMGNDAAAGKSLNALLTRVQEAIDETRRMMVELRPSILDDLGILAAMSWLCREFQKHHPQIRLEKQTDIPEEEIPEMLQTAIFRISQEALNNVLNHSQADLIKVSLRKNLSQVELTIQDNGVGFDVDKQLSWQGSKKGLGLISMRERTERLGGTFAIESVEPGGTSIQATWTVDKEKPVVNDL